jgi:hypothetical protein
MKLCHSEFNLAMSNVPQATQRIRRTTSNAKDNIGPMERTIIDFDDLFERLTDMAK